MGSDSDRKRRQAHEAEMRGLNGENCARNPWSLWGYAEPHEEAAFERGRAARARIKEENEREAAREELRERLRNERRR